MENNDITLSPFIRGKVHIFQRKKGYRFNLDPVLLADFFTPKKKKGKLIDLGTGSGILLLLISLRYKDLKFYALEIQDSLYNLAKKNFEKNKIDVNLISGDVRKIDKLFSPASFDYVITNPPYHKLTGKKPKNEEILVAKFEERATVEDFIKAASYLLKDYGSFYMINKAERLPEIVISLKRYRLEPKRLRFVHPTLKENSTHFLIECVKNAKEGCIVEKPLIVYKNPKEKIYTEEVNRLLEDF